jgi:hypothetical protein
MTQTPTKAEELAAAELRRLAAVEAERDDLKLAFAHTVRLVQDWTQSAYAMEAERDAMRLDYSRLLEKHNNLHANAARDRAERDALLAARTSPVHQPVHGWTDADADAARLALELECILTDRDTPMPVTTRWWESAHEALALHRQRLEDERRAAMKGTK